MASCVSCRRCSSGTVLSCTSVVLGRDSGALAIRMHRTTQFCLSLSPSHMLCSLARSMALLSKYCTGRRRVLQVRIRRCRGAGRRWVPTRPPRSVRKPFCALLPMYPQDPSFGQAMHSYGSHGRQGGDGGYQAQRWPPDEKHTAHVAPMCASQVVMGSFDAASHTATTVHGTDRQQARQQARPGSTFPSGWARLGVSGRETQTSKPIWAIVLQPHKFSAMPCQTSQTSVKICTSSHVGSDCVFLEGVSLPRGPVPIVPHRYHLTCPLPPGLGHPRHSPVWQSGRWGPLPPKPFPPISTQTQSGERANQKEEEKRDALPPAPRYDHEVPSPRDSPSRTRPACLHQATTPLQASLKPRDKDGCSMQAVPCVMEVRALAWDPRPWKVSSRQTGPQSPPCFPPPPFCRWLLLMVLRGLHRWPRGGQSSGLGGVCGGGGAHQVSLSLSKYPSPSDPCREKRTYAGRSCGSVRACMSSSRSVGMILRRPESVLETCTVEPSCLPRPGLVGLFFPISLSTEKLGSGHPASLVRHVSAGGGAGWQKHDQEKRGGETGGSQK